MMRILAALIMIAFAGGNASGQEGERGKQSDGTAPFGIATEESCIGGHNPFSNGTTERVRALAESTLGHYIDLAGTGSKVSARPLYTPKKHGMGWGDGYYEMKDVALSWARDGQVGDLDAVDDPVARSIKASGASGAAALHVERFFIAGAKLSAAGLWRVSAPTASRNVLGWYRARFMRRNSLGSQAWELISLDVITGSTPPAAIEQYCVEPGDVERNRVQIAEKKAEKARKKK